MEMDTTIQNQNPVETPQNQPPQGNIANQKGFFPIAIGVIILLLVVSGGAYYLGTQRNQSENLSPRQTTIPSIKQAESTNTPTSRNESNKNWKTLTNAKYGYSFSYPSNKYNETIYTTEPFLYAVSYCPSKKLEDCAFPSNIFQVIAYDNPQNVDLESWIKTNESSPIYQQGKMKCFFNDPRTVNKTESFLGIPSISYKFTVDQDTAKGVCKGLPLEGGGEFKYILTKKGDRIFWISINQASKEIYSELEQILATLKFTN